MDILFIIIFILTLFIYVHIVYHWKLNNDTDIHDLGEVGQGRLNELCQLRQPLIIASETKDISLSKFNIRIENKYHVITDISDSFISERNETNIHMFSQDNLLRPPLTMYTNFDIWCGKNSVTPTRYHLAHRMFMHSLGNIVVKLTPPDNAPDLDIINDYELYEFRTKHQPKSSISIKLNPNQILFIPPYWFYSIEYNDLSYVLVYQYFTYMSELSVINHRVLEYMQKHNVKYRIEKKKYI